MSIFDKNFYLRPILIVLHREEEEESFLFAGKVDTKIQNILEKLLDKKGDLSKLPKSQQQELENLYGPNFAILKKKIKLAQHLIFQTIYLSDNILSLKKKIFVHLSNKNNIIIPENQYLYIKHKIDDKFFLQIIENLYLSVTSISKKELRVELTKILDKKINLTKKIYLQAELKKLLVETFRERSSNYYNLPISVKFLHRANDKYICEYANPYHNKDFENLHHDKTINNDYTLLNNYTFDHSIHLVNLDDYKKSKNYQPYVEDRYWLTPRDMSVSEFESKKKDYLEIFKSIDDKIEKIYVPSQNSLNQKLIENSMGIYAEICSDKINAISLLYKPILDYHINLVKLFDIFKVSRDIPYLNYVGEKRKQSRVKIYEPAYYGDEVEINELLLKKWREEKITHQEEGYLTKKHYINLKCKYKDSYISFLLAQNGTIIINLTAYSMHKKNLFNIDTGEVIKLINNLVITNINKTLGGEKSKNRIEDIKMKYIEYLQFSGCKEIKLHKNINSNILYKLLHHYHEFFFLKFKQLKDDIDLGFKKKKNNYGMKRVDNFGSIRDIESYISQLILESNNELDNKVIESKIQNSFNISKSESINIYSNLIKNLTDAVHDEVDAEKINIISLVRKHLKNHKEHITFQIYLIGDNLNINFAHVQNETELVFLNNFLNLVIKEFLLKKTYTQTAKENKIQAQEKKLDAAFEKQLSLPENIFEPSVEPGGVFFDNSSSNNSNSNSNSNDSNNEASNTENSKAVKPDKSVEEPSITEELPDIPIDDEPIEYDNLKEYFTEMRARFDPELFISKRKTKDKLITDKREEAKIKYTTRCQSVNDKFPIIISKNKLEAFQNDPKILEGLDVFQYQELDKKTGQVVKQKATYYILGGHRNKNVYICPRLWCVRCEIPISPIDFVKKTECPRCHGKVLKDKKEKITNQKTVYVRNHPNTWKDTKDKSFLNRYLNEVLNPKYQKNQKLENLVIKELKASQKSMYPYYLKPQKIDKNIALTCCGSKTLPVEEEEEVVEKTTKGETIYYFLTKTDVVEQDKLALPSDTLGLLLGNEKEKKSRKQMKYYFNLLGKNYIYNDYLKQKKKIYRLGVEPSVKNGFTMCINYILYFLAKIENRDAPNKYYIQDIFENPDIYKPSLFVQLVNGNSVELFRNKNTLSEYLESSDIPNKGVTLQSFKDWIVRFTEDLKLLGIDELETFNFSKLKDNKNVNQLWNIFTAFNYFRKYMLDSAVVKNMEFVWDFFQRENVIHPLGVNIIILELNNDLKETQYSLVCPKYYAGSDFYHRKRPSLIILKYGKNYELVSQIDFRFKSAECQPVQILFSPATLSKLKPPTPTGSKSNESLINILLHKCSQMGQDKSKVRLHSLLRQLDRDGVGKEFEVTHYVRGKYPKILGVILRNKMYLPVYPESIKNYQLGKIVGIQDIKKTQLVTLSQFLKLSQELQKHSSFFKYLEIKHIFVEEDSDSSPGKETREALGFIRLESQSLIPIKKYGTSARNTLLESYSEEQVEAILSGIHTVETNKREENARKMDEFSIDNLIFDQEMPEDERTTYIKNYQNNEKEFKNIILGVNSFLTYEKNKKISTNILKLIMNPVLPLVKKRREIKEIFQEEKIFDKLFLMTDKKYFKKKVPIVACYQTENVSQCKKDVDKKYKIPISATNLVNGMPNDELFLNLIIEKLVRNPLEGQTLISQKIEEYELKSLGSLEKKDQIIFGADSLQRIFQRLYSKRKVKFLRDVENVNTKKEFQNVDYSPLPEEMVSQVHNETGLLGDTGMRDTREILGALTGDDSVMDNKVNIPLNLKKTKKRIRKSIGLKQDRKKNSSILVATEQDSKNLKVKAGKVDMFGITDKSAKVSEGECVFPFNMTTRQKVDGKNISRPWHSYQDCVMSKEGPFCATEVKKTKKAVQGKLKRLAEYQETGKHPSRKGYCDWESFFQRELQIRLLGKKPNPNCQKNYKIFKDTGDGKKKLVEIQGCMPDQVENIDVENPRYVCPNKKEVKKGDVFYKSKHKQEDCYV